MAKNQPTTIRCSFNGSLSVEARSERLSAIAGVLALREIDERLGLTASFAPDLHDPRSPLRILHPLEELLRTRLYLIACGHRLQSDADLLRDDPACRLAVSERRGVSPLQSEDESGPEGLPSQPSQSRLLNILSIPANLQILRAALFENARRLLAAEPGRYKHAEAILDIDSFPLEVHGHQPGSAYNGYYSCRCFHPLAIFHSGASVLLDLALRPGNVHTADGATEQICSVLDRIDQIANVASVRGDAGFPGEGLCAALEERDVDYTFRLKKNDVLAELAKPFLVRPQGRKPDVPRVWTHDIAYQAESWSRPRRVVIVVLERPGELFLDWFAIVTSWPDHQRSGEQILDFYRDRGTMEAHLGEFKGLEPALSSTRRPKTHIHGRLPRRTGTGRFSLESAERANEATLLLYAHAYNLLNAARRVLASEIAPERRVGLRLSTMRAILLCVAARLIVSGRRITVVLDRSAAEVWTKFWHGLRRLRSVEFCDTS